MRGFTILLLAVLLVGCTGFSRWAVNLESRLECGMSVAEVEHLADRVVRVLEGRRGYPYGPWETHRIESGFFTSDYLSLGFIDGTLHFVQVRWPVAMSTKVAEHPFRDLCGTIRAK